MGVDQQSIERGAMRQLKSVARFAAPPPITTSGIGQAPANNCSVTNNRQSLNAPEPCGSRCR